MEDGNMEIATINENMRAVTCIRDTIYYIKISMDARGVYSISICI